MSEWSSTLLVDFMPFLPIVQWWWTGGGSGGGDGGGAQWDTIALNRRIHFIGKKTSQELGIEPASKKAS